MMEGTVIGREDDLKEQMAERVSVSAVAHREEERRRQERFECEGFAEVSSANGLRAKGCIADVSLGGCFVETQPSFNLERGTQVEVYFETKHLRFRVGGNILNYRPGEGVGIAFLHPSARTVRLLEDLIAELAAGC